MIPKNLGNYGKAQLEKMLRDNDEKIEELHQESLRILKALEKFEPKPDKNDWDDRGNYFANDGIDCSTKRLEAA